MKPNRDIKRTTGLLAGLLLASSPVGMWAASATSSLLVAEGATVAAATAPRIQATNAPDQRAATTYQGVVVDDNTGDPIIGATVALASTPGKAAAVTDADGKFTLRAASGESIVVTYIGYQEHRLKLTSATLLNIRLKEDVQTTGEVVVTAFGVGKKKESVVGSVVQVRPDDLLVPSSNLTNSFAGRLSGVVSFQRSGRPGADGSTFYIRGISTLTAQNPLVIIDGVEASQSDLNAIDPEVIDGFSILKDATATAMYGTRGANGVVIVTTKSGANMEKAKVNVRLEGYVAQPTYKAKFVDGVTYMKMFNEAVGNLSNGVAPYSDDRIAGTMQGLDPYAYPNVDWYGEMFKNATFNQKLNVNVRGGSKRMDYFVNLNAVHEEGMLKGRAKDFYSYDNNINIHRYTFQSNINLYLTNTTKLSFNLGAEINDNRNPATSVEDVFGAIMARNPVDFPAFYPMESWLSEGGATSDQIKWGVYNGGNRETASNPLAEATKGYSDTFASTVRANIRLDQKLDFVTPGLSASVLFSFKNWSTTTVKRSRNYNKYVFLKQMADAEGMNHYLIRPLSVENSYTLDTKVDYDGDRRIYLQASLNYDRTFAKYHNVSAMLLYNQDEFNKNKVGGDTSMDRLINSLPRRKMGVAARLSYDYDRRYLMELNMGYNGSENFAKGHRFGFFPSIAVGYNISQEKFWEKIRPVVSNLKIRYSYGLVGNADSGTRFMYLPTVNLSGLGVTFSDGESEASYNGIKYTRFGNDDIKWEVGYKSNIGMDIQLFNSLNLTLDYFTELRKDIYQENKAIPNYMGVADTKLYSNTGEVKNWGFEIAIDYGKRITRDFTMELKGTFSFSRNKVQKYAEAFDPNYPNLSIIGHSLKTNIGYVYAGHLFVDKAEVDNSPRQQISGNVSAGDIKYVDLPNINGETDGIINDYDRMYMGYPTVPEIVFGIGPSFKYKNWDFSFFFQGVANTSLMMNGFHPFGTTTNRNVLQFIADNYYSNATRNIHAAYPRLTQAEQGNNTAASDYWLRDASFVKLRNAELGYSFKFARVYISGSNLLRFSKFKAWDPEQGGGNGLAYPTQRVINFGVQLSI